MSALCNIHGWHATLLVPLTCKPCRSPQAAEAPGKGPNDTLRCGKRKGELSEGALGGGHGRSRPHAHLHV